MKRGLSLVVLALCTVPALAQPAAPVYPSYEGFKPNDDGTFTLVFGYHNPNTVAVTIPPGEANGFDPGPDERGQPTVFLPGRQRNVCVMVVGPEFAGKNLRWSLQWGGETVSTTERGGPDPLYLLEEVGAAYRVARQIDTATAERGVCINTPPIVFVSPRMDAVVGEPLEVVARIGDDGLPRGSELQIRWRKVSGPEEPALSAADAAATSVIFSSPGEYELEVSATDGEMSREATMVVLVRGSR